MGQVPSLAVPMGARAGVVMFTPVLLDLGSVPGIDVDPSSLPG